MLYDSKMIFDDQLSAGESESKKYGITGEKIDMVLLVDDLQSEREQGITIDVAYRFFAKENRKFIIADTPDHEQYTRNMVTGASTADVVIILIDARKGILTQTRRHSFIVNLLGIDHVIVAINKMDLVNFSEDVFKMRSNKPIYSELADELDIKNTYYTRYRRLMETMSSIKVKIHRGLTANRCLACLTVWMSRKHKKKKTFVSLSSTSTVRILTSGVSAVPLLRALSKLVMRSLFYRRVKIPE